MGARTARIGFIGYAATLVALVGVGLWNALVMQRLGHEPSSGFDWQLKLVGALYVGLDVLGAVALVLMSRVPAATRARPLFVAAAFAVAAALVVYVAERVVLDGHITSIERIETLLRAVNVFNSVVYAASEILLGVAALRIARAASDDRVRALALAAIVARAIVLAVQLAPVHLSWILWVHYATNVLLAVLCVVLARVVMRVADPETPAAATVDGRLGDEWRAPANGISLYLGAGVARIACALLSGLVMFGARNAHSLDELRDVRTEMLLVAALTAGATLTMLWALWRLSSAPLESRASGPARVALTLALIGFGLDLWSTYLTADALDGNVSAAFFAMDAIPIIGACAGLLGVGVAVSLLVAFANLATALERAEVAAQARAAIGWVLGTGALLGAAFALVRMVELMLVVVAIALPLAIVALVQFVRVALAVAREIRARA